MDSHRSRKFESWRWKYWREREKPSNVQIVENSWAARLWNHAVNWINQQSNFQLSHMNCWRLQHNREDAQGIVTDVEINCTFLLVFFLLLYNHCSCRIQVMCDLVNFSSTAIRSLSSHPQHLALRSFSWQCLFDPCELCMRLSELLLNLHLGPSKSLVITMSSNPAQWSRSAALASS
jgi:hypothetical protein